MKTSGVGSSPFGSKNIKKTLKRCQKMPVRLAGRTSAPQAHQYPNRAHDELLRELLRCAPPFYTTPLSPNQICRLTQKTHAHSRTHTHYCRDALLSVGCVPQTQPFPPPSKTRRKTLCELSEMICSSGQHKVNRNKTMRRDTVLPAR